MKRTSVALGIPAPTVNQLMLSALASLGWMTAAASAHEEAVSKCPDLTRIRTARAGTGGD